MAICESQFLSENFRVFTHQLKQGSKCMQCFLELLTLRSLWEAVENEIKGVCVEFPV